MDSGWSLVDREMLSIYIEEYIAEKRFSLDPGNILILVYNIFESEAQRFNQMIIVFLHPVYKDDTFKHVNQMFNRKTCKGFCGWMIFKANLL